MSDNSNKREKTMNNTAHGSFDLRPILTDAGWSLDSVDEHRLALSRHLTDENFPGFPQWKEVVRQTGPADSFWSFEIPVLRRLGVEADLAVSQETVWTVTARLNPQVLLGFSSPMSESTQKAFIEIDLKQLNEDIMEELCDLLEFEVRRSSGRETRFRCQKACEMIAAMASFDSRKSRQTVIEVASGKIIEEVFTDLDVEKVCRIASEGGDFCRNVIQAVANISAIIGWEKAKPLHSEAAERFRQMATLLAAPGMAELMVKPRLKVWAESFLPKALGVLSELLAAYADGDWAFLPSVFVSSRGTGRTQSEIEDWCSTVWGSEMKEFGKQLGKALARPEPFVFQKHVDLDVCPSGPVTDGPFAGLSFGPIDFYGTRRLVPEGHSFVFKLEEERDFAVVEIIGAALLFAWSVKSQKIGEIGLSSIQNA